MVDPSVRGVSMSTSSAERAWLWPAVVVIAFVGLLSLPVSGHSLGRRFFDSLRVAKQQPVGVNIPSFSGPNASRQLQDMITGMLGDKVNIIREESEQSAVNANAASKAAGFTARLPSARKDPAALSVLGARTIEVKINRAQLKTLFAQAGRPNVTLPAGLDAATVTVRTPRAVRAQYGNCPAPVANTLQSQINGPPPPSTDNGNCVMLTESPAADADVPPGLATADVVEIALELSGMSPNQTRAFQNTFDWRTTLTLSLPRGMRSYDLVTVDGVRGMLVTTAARRGPTYTLIWAKNGTVYSLAGYGSPGDAVPLANSIT